MKEATGVALTALIKGEKSAKIILNLMIEDPFCYPPSFEKLTGDLTCLYTYFKNVDSL